MIDVVEVSRARDWGRTGRARRIRTAAGVSLDEVAAALGTTKKSVSRWELGQCAPRAQVAAAYIRLLQRLERRVRVA